jgi:nitronate monooxygenase
MSAIGPKRTRRSATAAAASEAKAAAPLPEEIIVTRVFSGRPGCSIATAYARAATDPTAPAPAPYPVQRGLTQAMRDVGIKENDIECIQAWTGQSASLAKARPAGDVVRQLWEDALALLR